MINDSVCFLLSTFFFLDLVDCEVMHIYSISKSKAVFQRMIQVSVPIAPDIGNAMYGACRLNIIEAVVTEDFCKLERPVISQERNGISGSGKCGKSKLHGYHSEIHSVLSWMFYLFQ